MLELKKGDICEYLVNPLYKYLLKLRRITTEKTLNNKLILNLWGFFESAADLRPIQTLLTQEPHASNTVRENCFFSV